MFLNVFLVFLLIWALWIVAFQAKYDAKTAKNALFYPIWRVSFTSLVGFYVISFLYITINL